MHTEMGTSVTEDVGWVADVVASSDARRNTVVLICAEEPLRSALVELARTKGYEPRETVTPLQAIEVLLESGDRIGHALISSELPNRWAEGINELIGDDYPHVRRYLLRVA